MDFNRIVELTWNVLLISFAETRKVLPKRTHLEKAVRTINLVRTELDSRYPRFSLFPEPWSEGEIQGSDAIFYWRKFLRRVEHSIRDPQLASDIVFVLTTIIAVLVVLDRTVSSVNPSTVAIVDLSKLCFPEECVAELGALQERLIRTYTKRWQRWLVPLILLRHIVFLFWAFYVQIRFDNFWMRKTGEVREIEK